MMAKELLIAILTSLWNKCSCCPSLDEEYDDEYELPATVPLLAADVADLVTS